MIVVQIESNEPVFRYVYVWEWFVGGMNEFHSVKRGIKGGKWMVLACQSRR